MKLSMIIISILFSTISWAQDCPNCGRAPAVVATPAVDGLSSVVREVASKAEMITDSKVIATACSAMESHDVGSYKYFLRVLKEKNLELGDVYFQIKCTTGVNGYLFHYAKTQNAFEYFLAYLKYREEQTGRKFLDQILNKVFPNYVFMAGAPQTLIDYLTYFEERASADMKSHYKSLIDLVRSYGGKYVSELQPQDI